MKYNNGRFFANLEYNNDNTSTTYNYSNAVTGHAPVHGLDGPRYLEGSRWLAEIGALCGPGKLTFAAIYSSGQVLPGVDVTDANKHIQCDETVLVFRCELPGIAAIQFPDVPDLWWW